MRFCLIALFFALSFGCNKTRVSRDEQQKQRPLTGYPGDYIASENRYTDPDGMVIVIQNSLPKGAAYNADGKNLQSRLFWNRVINEGTTPIELTVTFPADLAMLLSSKDYLKVFLPPDTMTNEKESEYGYGYNAARLTAFLDSSLTKSTTLHKTINPKEASLFYVGALFNKTVAVRAELLVKNKTLFYRFTGMSPMLDTAFIPCGRIVPLMSTDGKSSNATQADQ